MLRVNLIGKKRREAKGKNLVNILAVISFVAFVTYFFGSAFFVVYKLTTLKSQIAAVDQETKVVSGEILSNNELLHRYVLSKYILTKMENLNSGKFRYKEYLDSITSFLPNGVVLKSVDFSVKGWVSVSISADSLSALKKFEEIIADETTLNKSAFSSVFSESVARNFFGSYSIKLQFEIRQNGRK